MTCGSRERYFSKVHVSRTVYSKWQTRDHSVQQRPAEHSPIIYLMPSLQSHQQQLFWELQDEGAHWFNLKSTTSTATLHFRFFSMICRSLEIFIANRLICSCRSLDWGCGREHVVIGKLWIQSAVQRYLVHLPFGLVMIWSRMCDLCRAAAGNSSVSRDATHPSLVNIPTLLVGFDPAKIPDHCFQK